MHLIFGCAKLRIAEICYDDELVESNVQAVREFLLQSQVRLGHAPAIFVEYEGYNVYFYFAVIAASYTIEIPEDGDELWRIIAGESYELTDLSFIDDDVVLSMDLIDEASFINKAHAQFLGAVPEERTRIQDDCLSQLRTLRIFNQSILSKDMIYLLDLVYANKPDGETAVSRTPGLPPERSVSLRITDDIFRRLEGLKGMSEFKNYLNELEASRPYMEKWRAKSDFPTQHLLFAVDPGSGCSTAVSLLHEYLMETGLYGKLPESPQAPFKLTEKRFTWYSDDKDSSNYSYSRESVTAFLTEIEEYAPGILVLNIEDWLNHMTSSYFTEMLECCQKLRNSLVCVFTVPYLDEGILGRVHARLEDVLNVRPICFHPYSDEEMIEVAKDYLRGFDIGWDSSSDSYFKHLLVEERGDGRFYGMRTVKRLCTELILLKVRNISQKSSSAPPNMLTGEDFKAAVTADDGRSGFDQLDALIGLSDIKKRIRELVVSIKADRQLSGPENPPPCLHMLFTGSPGTGKTTVARIIGRIFREQGILLVGDLLEVSRFDLVGQWIGTTGPKTVERCRAARGSVMFIDEAYLLSGPDGVDTRDFGKEALGALVAEMENHRDKFVVIMAGYEDEMEKLLKVNPGLRARIPHKLHFPNYTRDELIEIFKMQIGDRYNYDDTLLEAAQAFFNNLKDDFMESKQFGNARFVRNLVERLRVKALLRMQGDLPDNGRLTLLAVDLESAISDDDMSGINKKEKRRRIGFYADAAQH